MLLVARTAQVAWMAVTLSLYVSYFVPLNPITSKLLGVAAILIFAAINYRGVSGGALVQKSFTFAKVAGLLIIICGALFYRGGVPASTQAVETSFSFTHFGVALIACLLAYAGWVQMSFVAGEIKNPSRNILLALALGFGAVFVLFMLSTLP